MPEMHLRQPGFTYSQHGFTYSVCEPFTKNKEEDRNLKKQVICNIYIYQNELEEACFQHDMAYGDFKDFTRRTASDKISHNKAFNIAKIPKYDGYQRGLLLMVYQCFINIW